MGVRTSNSAGDFEIAPAGMHVARCFRVIDCGTVNEAKWGKKKHLGWIFWELPNALQAERPGEDRRPHMVGKRYTLSHNEKANLRLDMESWFGKRFDTAVLDRAGGFALEKLIGRPALLNIVHSEDGRYANISSVNPLPAGMICPPAFCPTLVFGFDPYRSDIFESLSGGMKEFIRGSEEWQLAVNGHAAPSAQPAGGAPAAAPAASAGVRGLAEDDPISMPAYGTAMHPPTRSKFDDMADDIPF